MILCKIKSASDVLQPDKNPSCDLENILLSMANFVNRWFKIDVKNLEKQDNNDIPL